MLAELSIRNFAVIEAADIRFGPGLNVLTGETGAGKSILIDALGAVLGARTSADMVRAGARSASIDATFDLARVEGHAAVASVLAELLIEPEDGRLILSREIQAGGRSVARLNGRPTTAAVLSQIGALLVDVHGQSDHLSLLRPRAQLEILDRFARTMGPRDQVRQRVGELRRVRSALSDAIAGSRERIQRVDLLRYQIAEIAEAGLSIDEETRLVAEQAKLANIDRLSRDAAAAHDKLAGTEDTDDAQAALPSIRKAAAILDEMAGLDESSEPLREHLKDILFSLEDMATEVRDYRDALESNPARLEAVEDRLTLVRQLKRKYGTDIEDVLKFAEDAEQELSRLTGSEVDVEALAARDAVLASEIGTLADDLSHQRSDSAAGLSESVERAIADLKMGSAEFVVSLERRQDRDGVPVPLENGDLAVYAFDATGIDNVAFLVAPNAGEGLKPLARIASGGETARIMLALKSILSDVDETPTLVFDEIDVGVGGRSGQVVGEKLAQLAAGHQVITITHMPQIAAFADWHFCIVKAENAGRVISTVELLGDSQREEELAAMIDGVPITGSALQNARDMLIRARGARREPALRQ